MPDIFRSLRQSIRRLTPRWPVAALRSYLVATILVATVPLAALMSYQIFGQISAQGERMHDDLERNASVLAQSVDRELTSSIEALTILSYSAELQEERIAAFAQALQVKPLMRRSWSSVYLLSLDGDVLFDSARAGGTLRRRDGVADTLSRLARQTAVISDIQFDRDEGVYVTTLEVAVRAGNAPRYLLGARIPAERWQELTNDLTFPDLSSMVGRDFRFIVRSQLGEKFVGSEVPMVNQQLMCGKPSGAASLFNLQGGKAYAAWDTVPLSGWFAATGAPAGPIDALRNQAIFAALATAVSCLLLGLYLALLVARRIADPMRELALGRLGRSTENIQVLEISALRDALAAARA